MYCPMISEAITQCMSVYLSTDVLHNILYSLEKLRQPFWKNPTKKSEIETLDMHSNTNVMEIVKYIFQAVTVKQSVQMLCEWVHQLV